MTTYGIMSAMDEEIRLVLESATIERTETLGGRTFHIGTLCRKNVVIVHSRWGKVASAVTASKLINSFGVTRLIFTGVAGGIGKGLSVGDVVVSDRVFQHDMDAQPFFDRGFIPLLNEKFFEAEASLIESAKKAAESGQERVLAGLSSEDRALVSESPKVVVGTIATGDKFINSAARVEDVLSVSDCTLAVEMEGGAVGQVCAEHGVPFVVIRTLSDSADSDAVADFGRFVEHVASVYSREIIVTLLEAA